MFFKSCVCQLSYCLLLILAIFLQGCGASDEQELKRYIASVKKRPAKPVQAIPKFKSVSNFAYLEDKTRRNPFFPINLNKKTHSLTERRPTLESFPLHTLKFVGLIKEETAIWGLVRLPTGLIERVKPGELIGENGGKVIHISEKSLEIQEKGGLSENQDKKNIELRLGSVDIT